MKFRSKGKGAGRQVYPVRGRSLFNGPRHPRLAGNIHWRNETEAKESVTWLDKRWVGGSRQDRVLAVQMANKAANQATAELRRTDLSPEERRRIEEGRAELRGWVDRHKGKESTGEGHNYPPGALKKLRADPLKDAPTSYNPEGGYEGWTNHDTWNTKLILDNDEQSRKQEEAWGKNFLRKEKSGKYDRDAARYAVLKYLIPLAKKQDPEIDAKNVDLGEIADSILNEARENQKYKESQKQRRIDQMSSAEEIAESDKIEEIERELHPVVEIDGRRVTDPQEAEDIERQLREGGY